MERVDDTFVVRVGEQEEFFVSTPLVLDEAHAEKSFAIHRFARKDLSENSVRQVLVRSGKGRTRIGWLIPANALGSVDHDESGNEYFLKYAYMTIQLALREIDLEVLRLKAADAGAAVNIADLFDDNIAFLTISEETLGSLAPFDISQIVPALVRFGFVPERYYEPGQLEWSGPDTPLGHFVLERQSSAVASPEMVSRLISLAVTSSSSPITQFFYSYQVFEYLMELVLAERLSKVAKEISVELSKEGQGFFGVRDALNDLSEEMNEKKRLNRLVTDYSQGYSLDELEFASNELLVKSGQAPKQGIAAMYSVRNLVFHRARDVPDEAMQILVRLVRAMLDLFPELLASFEPPAALQPGGTITTG
ncbi:hypothetical protein ASF30_14780 [Leifsonia sp. Leaf264]|nr:hypothetical protein ASF30_14780 [Leifsonia sp. Leaf264]